MYPERMKGVGLRVVSPREDMQNFVHLAIHDLDFGIKCVHSKIKSLLNFKGKNA